MLLFVFFSGPWNELCYWFILWVIMFVNWVLHVCRHHSLLIVFVPLQNFDLLTLCVMKVFSPKILFKDGRDVMNGFHCWAFGILDFGKRVLKSLLLSAGG
jgi:hypothetical protein